MTVDITEFKRTELELEILRDQFEKFSTNVRHDLKNPLQVAMGHLQLARTSGADESFDAVQESLERIEEIVTDLESIAKDLSSAPSGRTNSSKLPTRCGTSSTRAMRPSRTSYRPLQPSTLPKRRFGRFREPVQNAIDHGESDVTVRVGPLEDGFYVEDTGPGIPESERESVLQAGTPPNRTEAEWA